MSEQQEYSLGDEVPFGKHEGEKLSNIIDGDIHYVRWLVDDGVLSLTEEAYEYYEQAAEDAGLM